MVLKVFIKECRQELYILNYDSALCHHFLLLFLSLKVSRCNGVVIFELSSSFSFLFISLEDCQCWPTRFPRFVVLV